MTKSSEGVSFLIRSVDFPVRYVNMLCINPFQGFFNKRTMKIAEYIKQTKVEMSHVVWPSRNQTVSFTLMVIAVSLLTAILLGVSDFVFSRLLTLLF